MGKTLWLTFFGPFSIIGTPCSNIAASILSILNLTTVTIKLRIAYRLASSDSGNFIDEWEDSLHSMRLLIYSSLYTYSVFRYIPGTLNSSELESFWWYNPLPSYGRNEVFQYGVRIRHLTFQKWSSHSIRVTMWFIVPNFIIIGSFSPRHTYRHNDFHNSGRPPSWICDDIIILQPVIDFHGPNTVLNFHHNCFGVFLKVSNTRDWQTDRRTSSSLEAPSHPVGWGLNSRLWEHTSSFKVEITLTSYRVQNVHLRLLTPNLTAKQRHEIMHYLYYELTSKATDSILSDGINVFGETLEVIRSILWLIRWQL